MKVTVLATISVFLTVCTTALAADSPSGTGVVTYVKGNAQRKGGSAEAWEKAQENTRLDTGDKVKTLEKTRAEIKLDAGRIIRLDENTTVDLVKLFEESRSKTETEIKIEQGNLWAKVYKLGEDMEFKVETPAAGAAVRGTTFRVAVPVDGSTVLNVYEGAVEIYNPLQQKTGPITRIEAPREVAKPGYIEGPKEVGIDEWRYIVMDMQRFTIDRTGVRRVSPFRTDEPDEQSDWVSWNRERDRELEKNAGNRK